MGATDDRAMKQVDADQTTSTMTSDEQVSADYLLLHTAHKAGEQQRRRQQSNALTVTTSDADRRRPSVPRLQVEPDDEPSQQLHRRTHSLKCPSSSPSPAARRQSTVRRAGSVKSTPPRSARNPSPTVYTAVVQHASGRQNQVLTVVNVV